MEQQKVDQFIISNKQYFPDEKIMYLKDKLSMMDESKLSLISTIKFKNPTTILIISIFLGGLGVDRFMLGEIGMGILKLCTGGCCGVLWLIDLFSVSKKAKEWNFNTIMTLI